jgi:hypothetical protein
LEARERERDVLCRKRENRGKREELTASRLMVQSISFFGKAAFWRLVKKHESAYTLYAKEVTIVEKTAKAVEKTTRGGAKKFPAH